MSASEPLPCPLRLARSTLARAIRPGIQVRLQTRREVASVFGIGWLTRQRPDPVPPRTSQHARAAGAGPAQWEMELAVSRAAADSCWPDEVARDGGVLALLDTPAPHEGCDGHRWEAPVFEHDGSWYALNVADSSLGRSGGKPYVGWVTWGQDLRGVRRLLPDAGLLSLEVHIARLTQSPFLPPPPYEPSPSVRLRPPEHGPEAQVYRIAARTSGGVPLPAIEFGGVTWPDGRAARVPTPRMVFDLWCQQRRIVVAAGASPT